jgi:hypothetical protein
MMQPMAPDTRSPAAVPAIAPEPAEPDVARAVTTSGAPGSTATLDVLTQTGTLCPYLRMTDGSYRAFGASRDHRCWAVEPPATIPAATQADLCLVVSHAGCQRYVAAQDKRAAGLATDHIPDRLVRRPRFVIPVDPVPVVVDAKPSGRDPGTAPSVVDDAMRRRLPLIAAGVGVAIVALIGLAAIFGGTGQPGPTPPLAAVVASGDPAAGATAVPAATAGPTQAATPGATQGGPAASAGSGVVPQGEPTAIPEPSYPVEIARTYVVKEGDTYRSLAKRFGVRPRDLRALNGSLVVGERILIPAEPWVTDAPGD